MTRQLHFSSDIAEFLSLLIRHKVRYLIVGGEAVIYYGHARLTGDIDIFYDRRAANTTHLFSALKEFWDDDVPGMAGGEELLNNGMIFQFGVPPNRIDLMNEIENVDFKSAWANRALASIRFKGKKVPIYFLGLNELIRNKETVGRHRDMDDLQFLKARAAKIRRKSKR